MTDFDAGGDFRLPDDRTSSGPFYGWVVVAASFTVMFVAFSAAYCFPAFYLPLSAEFGVTNAEMSTVFSITAALFFGIGGFTGKLADKFGARPVILYGVILVAIGLYLASIAETMLQIYVAVGVSVGLGVGFCYVPAVGPVQRWFIQRRVAATGFAVLGIGMASFLAPRIMGWVIETYDWRTAYFYLTILVVALGLVAAWLLVNDPADKGQHPDGQLQLPAAAQGMVSVGTWTAVTSLPFWLVYLGVVAMSFGLFIPPVHLPRYSETLQLTADLHPLIDPLVGTGGAAGLTLVAVLGLGSIVGRLILSPLAARLGSLGTMIFLYIVMGAMLGLWLIAGASFWKLAVFALVFGMSYGGFVAISPTVMTEYFGVRNAGSIIGWLYTAVGLGVLLGPWFAGYMYDRENSYDTVLMICIGLCAFAAFLIVICPSARKWRAARVAAENGFPD